LSEEPRDSTLRMISSLKIVRRFQRRREIHKIAQSVSDRPTPRKYEGLCERLLATRGAEAAVGAITEARKLFPWSERLEALHSKIRIAASRDEIARLQADAERAPSPEAYGRLAEALRKVGEDDEAIRYCRLSASSFPSNENAFLVEGRIRMEKLRRTGLVRDGMLAVENLERAISLNTDNTKARRLLADLYLEIGARSRARPHLEYLASEIGFQEAIDRLASDDGTTENADLSELFRRAKRTPSPGSAPSREPVLGRLVEELRATQGVHEIVTLGFVEGEAPEIERTDGVSAELRAVSALIARQAQGSLVEMDMGNLRYGELTGSWGTVLLFRLDETGIAMRTDGKVDLADLREKVLSVPAVDSFAGSGERRVS